ncbi:hypothetical protein D3C87_2045430 [compost metagenome]
MADDFFTAFEQALAAAAPAVTTPAEEVMAAPIARTSSGIPYARLLPWIIGLSAAAATAFTLLR